MYMDLLDSGMMLVGLLYALYRIDEWIQREYSYVDEVDHTWWSETDSKEGFEI
jgi:hypothetical protein